MEIGMRGLGFFGLGEHAWIGLLHHLLAEIHAHQIVLKDVVIEHVLGCFAEVHNPFPQRWWAHAKRHILRVGGARGMVVTANSTDAAGYEVRVTRILALHKNAVATEDRRGAMTFGNLPVVEVNLSEYPQTAHDPSNRIPIHLHQFS